MKSHLAVRGLGFAERIRAVDFQLGLESLGDRTALLRRYYNPMPTELDGEHACAMSHLITLERIATGEDAWALVLEDDVDLIPGFVSAANWLLRHVPQHCEMLILHKFSGVADIKHLTRLFHRIIDQPRTHGALGYLISREGAAHLLELLCDRAVLDTIPAIDLAYNALKPHLGVFGTPWVLVEVSAPLEYSPRTGKIHHRSWVWKLQQRLRMGFNTVGLRLLRLVDFSCWGRADI